jgi:hypothetical protein
VGLAGRRLYVGLSGSLVPECRRLYQLSHELTRIAFSLEETEQPGAALASVTAEYVSALIKARRARLNFFSADHFFEPAWDMMLDLFLARKEQRLVCVSSVCAAANVPTSTALRWIRKLESDGTVLREPDPNDRRRVFICLSDPGAARVEAALLEGRVVMARWS